MPIEIEGHGTVFTEAEVNKHYVAKVEVRENYVSKADHQKRLDQKQKALDKVSTEATTWKDKYTNDFAKLGELSQKDEMIAALQSKIHQRDDYSALKSAGFPFVKGEDGVEVPDPMILDLFQHSHGKVYGELDEEGRPDQREHFRAWLADEEKGARALPVWNMIPKQQQSTTQQQTTRTTVTVPDTERERQTTTRVQRLTPDQARAAQQQYMQSPDFRRLKPEERRPALDKWRQEHLPQEQASA